MTTVTNRKHKYYAEAHLLNGSVGPVAQVKWEEDNVDGSRSDSAAKFEQDGIIIESGSSEVRGIKKAGGGWATYASSTLNNFAVRKNGKDVITADMIVGKISTEHPARKYVPSLSFVGTTFVNLKINGQSRQPVLDLNIAGGTPAEQFDEDNNKKPENKVPYLVEYVTSPTFMDNAKKQGGLADGKKIQCSLVTEIKGPSGTTKGHVIDVPGFGKIALAELNVENHFDLNMMRLILDDGREITVGGPGTNGVTRP